MIESLLKIISLLLGLFLLYISVLLYEEEEKGLEQKLDRTWKGLKQKTKSGKLSYRALRSIYFSNLKKILKKLFLSSSIYTAIGVSIVLSFIPYLVFRLYWVTFVVPGWTNWEYILHYGMRVTIISGGIYLIASLYSKNSKRKKKAISLFDAIAIGIFFPLLLFGLLQFIGYYFLGITISKYALTQSLQYISCLFISIALLVYFYALYKKLSNQTKLYVAFSISALGFLYVIHIFYGVYFFNRSFYINLFGEEEGIFHIESLQLFNQIFAMTFFPIFIVTILFLIHFIILFTKPLTSLVARILYSVQRNRVLKQKKLLIIISLILMSFYFPIFKKLLSLVEIGL